MYFLIKDDELLKKYNDIWNKFNNSIIKEFDCKPIYNIFFLKNFFFTVNRLYIFMIKKIPKVDCNYICLAVILIDFIFKTDETVICKCSKRIQIHGKRKMVLRYISDGLNYLIPWTGIFSYSIYRNVASLNILVRDVINLLYYLLISFSREWFIC